MITREEIGQESAIREMAHETAIEHVREIFVAEGFGVPVEISPSERLNENVEADSDPYDVIGACTPEMAERALTESGDIGALFPCDFIIREVDPGAQKVYDVPIMRIAQLLGMAPENDAVARIVADTVELVEAAFGRLRS